MEFLFGYVAVGFISGICFDIVIFFFGRNLRKLVPYTSTW